MEASVEDFYLTQVGAPKHLDAAEEAALFRDLQHGVPCEEQIVKTYAHLVYCVARRYVRANIELDDLVQEGNLGLLRAIKTFDPDRHVRFTTYAWLWIKQRIMRSIWKNNLINIPVHCHESLITLRKYQDKLLAELEREPTYEELSNASGIPLKQVDILLRAYNKPCSLDHSIADDDSEALTFANTIAIFDDYNIATPDWEALAAAVNSLCPRERYILATHFGINTHPHALSEIGAVLRLTKGRVGQIEKAAMKKLRKKIAQQEEFSSLLMH